jgi:hypothetical protein
MKRVPLWIGIAFFVAAAVIFAFADGARRVYSGALFIVLGATMVAAAKRRA